MNGKVRTAVAGCGKVAHLHAAALGALPEAEFVAVTDANFERAREFAARYQVRAYSDLKSLIEDSRVEAVIVCTPHPAHRAPAVRAAEAGVHVLVEKPLASSLSDCDAIIEAAARHGVKLGVVSQRRFFEPVFRMKAAIDAGKLGAPVLGTVAMFSWRDENYYRSDPWRGKWDTEGGGVLINQSPHHLDILQWLMGPIDEISGYHANLNHPYIEVEDTALAMIRFRSGALASVVVSRVVQKTVPIYTELTARTDANDMLYHYDCSRDYNPQPDLEKIKAPLYAVNSADDQVNPPELGILEREIKRVKRGRYILIPTSDETRGHGTHSLPAIWGKYLAELFKESEPAPSGH